MSRGIVVFEDRLFKEKVWSRDGLADGLGLGLGLSKNYCNCLLFCIAFVCPVVSVKRH